MQKKMDNFNFYHGYFQELKSRKIRINEARWKKVLIFRKHLLYHYQWKECKVLHALRKLSNSFFRYEKQRFVSRSNFLICLQENNLSLNASRAISIYDTFDVLQKNAFDWRIFVFMIFVTFIGVNENVKHLLRYAFRFYIGQYEDLDKACASKVNLLNLDVIFEMLIRPDKVEHIIKLFDNEWTRLALQNEDSVSSHSGSSISLNISFDRFSSILEVLPVFEEFEHEEQLRCFEEEYYPQPLFKHRRCLRYMTSFIEMNTTKLKSGTFTTWMITTKHRQKIRHLCNCINNRNNAAILSFAFEKWWYNTIMHVASIVIQCAYRFSSANTKFLKQRLVKLSATTIQRLARGFLARQQYARRMRKRIFAAKTIQRSVRGILGRQVADKKLLTLIDTLRLKQMKVEENIYHSRLVYFSTKIQKWYRENLAKQALQKAVEKKQRELKVMSEMQSLLLSEEKEQIIHRKQTEVYIMDAIEQFKANALVTRKIMMDREKVQKLHSMMKDTERNEEVRKREQEQNEYIQLMKERLRDEWAQKEKQTCKLFVDHCIVCLKTPETTSERKRGGEIRMMIRKRVKGVLERAKSRNINMETEEARVIAEKEIIMILMQGKAAELQCAMRDACIDLETRLRKKFKEEENIRETQELANAKKVLIRAVRRWLARLELRRRFTKKFEKLFDDKYQAFYYRNMRTGEVSWEKPKVLGKYDLPNSMGIEALYSSSLHRNNG